VAWWSRGPKWGVRLAGVWLILTGLVQLAPRLSFDGLASILAILAIAAGVLIVLDR
jgi:hypothetical protein